MNTERAEEDYFSIGDVMSFDSIEITNVNDNRAPATVIIKKYIILLVIFAMILGLFFI